MTETRQRQIDPESLSRMNAAKVTSLQDIFVNCMKGKVALVSGGASGLGYMVVSRLCEAGAKVVIASRGEARAQRALEDFKAKGYEVSWVQTDVSKVASCYEAVDYTAATYGGRGRVVQLFLSGSAGGCVRPGHGYRFEGQLLPGASCRPLHGDQQGQGQDRVYLLGSPLGRRSKRYRYEQLLCGGQGRCGGHDQDGIRGTSAVWHQCQLCGAGRNAQRRCIHR